MHKTNFYDRASEYGDETRATLAWIVERIAVSLPAEASVLELGLGFGDCAAGFAGRFARHVVVDAAQDVIDRFRREHPNAPTEVVCSFFEEFDTPERFDAVVMGFVLEHLEDPGLLLGRFGRFLSPGGLLFVTVPNALGLHRRLGHEMGLLENLYALSGYDLAAGHKRYYDPESLRAQVEGAGYEVLGLEGVLLKPVAASQMRGLGFNEKHMLALLRVGRSFPELANALLLTATLK
jgi:SAM-dependent methyltransferase